MSRVAGTKDRKIDGAIVFLFVLSGCVSAPVPAPATRTGPPPSSDVVVVEADVAARVNDYRRERGLGALASDAFLSELARDHSRRMASGRRDFGHDGFDERGEQVHETLGAVTVSENVAFNNYPLDRAAERVVTGWIQSPGHHENLIGAFNRMGTGAARTGDGVWYVTQLYAAVPATRR